MQSAGVRAREHRNEFTWSRANHCGGTDQSVEVGDA